MAGDRARQRGSRHHRWARWRSGDDGRGRLARGFFRCIERLEQADQHIANRWELARRDGEPLRENRELERPVRDEQDAAGSAAFSDLPEHHRYRDRAHRDRLQRLDPGRADLKSPIGVRPLNELRLLLPLERLAGAMCAHARDAHQRVEIEANQRAAMAAQPHLAILQEGDGGPVASMLTTTEATTQGSRLGATRRCPPP